MAVHHEVQDEEERSDERGDKAEAAGEVLPRNPYPHRRVMAYFEHLYNKTKK